jgi:2-amino-4-hydroxy-6-hydroxymethyldihydropteridine diphosphokinase
LNVSESLETGLNRLPGLHQACLNIGSNIQPEIHIPQAIELLRRSTQVEALSQCWETPAVGSEGPNFINLAIRLQTSLDAVSLKTDLIGSIEKALGRVRTQDKNAPRTIDLDIILFDGAVLETNLWRRLFVALPVSELFPDLVEPGSGLSLRKVAENLRQAGTATPRPGIL